MKRVKENFILWKNFIIGSLLIFLILYLNPAFDKFYHADALLHFNWAKVCIKYECNQFVYPTNTFFFPDFAVTFVTSFIITNKKILLVFNSTLIAIFSSLFLNNFKNKESTVFLYLLICVHISQFVFSLFFNENFHGLGQENYILAPYNINISWGHHTTLIIIGSYLVYKFIKDKLLNLKKIFLFTLLIFLLAASDGFVYSFLIAPILLLIFFYNIFHYNKISDLSLFQFKFLFLIFIFCLSLFLYENKGLYLDYNFYYPVKINLDNLYDLKITSKSLILFFCILCSLFYFLLMLKNNKLDIISICSFIALVSFVVSILIGHRFTHRYYGIVYYIPLMIFAKYHLSYNFFKKKNLFNFIIIFSGSILFIFTINNHKKISFLHSFEKININLNRELKNYPIIGFCDFEIGQKINFYNDNLYCIDTRLIKEKLVPNRWFVYEKFYKTATSNINQDYTFLLMENKLNLEKSALEKILKKAFDYRKVNSVKTTLIDNQNDKLKIEFFKID